MESNIVAAIIAASVSMVVSLLGWWIAGRRQHQSRRVERTLARLERQIGDFYGPLLGLVEEYEIMETVRKNILEIGKDQGKLTTEQEAIVRRFIYEKFEEPIHQRLRQLLDERLFLVQNGQIPESFHDYLLASVQEMIQYKLWAERNIGTEYVGGQRFPQSFSDEVRNTLAQLLNRYDGVLRGEEIPGITVRDHVAGLLMRKRPE